MSFDEKIQRKETQQLKLRVQGFKNKNRVLRNCHIMFSCYIKLLHQVISDIAPDNTAALVSFQPKGRKELAAIK